MKHEKIESSLGDKVDYGSKAFNLARKLCAYYPGSDPTYIKKLEQLINNQSKQPNTSPKGQPQRNNPIRQPNHKIQIEER